MFAGVGMHSIACSLVSFFRSLLLLIGRCRIVNQVVILTYLQFSAVSLLTGSQQISSIAHGSILNQLMRCVISFLIRFF